MRTKDLLRAAMVGLVAFGLAACGGGDQPDEGAPAVEEPAVEEPAAEEPAMEEPAEMGMPDWMQVDHDAQTVAIQLTAGSSSANNYWNYNGFYGGSGGITVPVGYTVTVTFTNQDPAMAHSYGVEEPMDTWPNQFEETSPEFEGAISSNPLSMTEATLPGETEEHTFVVSEAGDYVLVCYVTGHAATGMWLDFTVSADGEAGALM